MADDRHDEIRQQLELTGLAYADWEKQSVELRRLADRAASSGLVDSNRLQQAAKMAVAIAGEIRMLDGLGTEVDDETAQQIHGTRDRLAALLAGVREAERRLQAKR